MSAKAPERTSFTEFNELQGQSGWNGGLMEKIVGVRFWELTVDFMGPSEPSILGTPGFMWNEMMHLQ